MSPVNPHKHKRPAKKPTPKTKAAAPIVPPPPPQPETLDKQMNLRLSADLLEAWSRAADEAELPLAIWMRRVLNRASGHSSPKRI